MSGRTTLYIFQVDSAVVNIISYCVEDAIQTLKQYLPTSDIKLLKTHIDSRRFWESKALDLAGKKTEE